MDFSLSEVEEMLVESAGTFGERALRPAERSHEKQGAPGDAVRAAWDECGLAMLADPGD